MTSENRPYQPHPARSLMWHIGRQDDLTIGSLCSGYGGLEMGLQAVIGGRVAWHVEYDKHPSAVLAARFPGVPNYGDITTTDWSRPEPVDRGAEVAPDADVSTRPRDGVSERPDSESATEHRGQAESRRCRRAAADTDCTGRGGVTELNSGAPSRLDSEHRGHSDGRDDGVSWGPYAGAIRCWERATGRRAPAPTEPGSRGQQRLNARFVEWMMGLPDGWVTDVLPRNPALKALGNGVVPQQAALAVRTLLSLEGQVAA